ncbi:MAG: hypothetical protein ACQERF_01485 [Actinomycetota bacterium]
MRSSLVALEGGHEIVNQLPVHPVMYGVIALVVLLFLLLVAYAFRSVGTRH